HREETPHRRALADDLLEGERAVDLLEEAAVIALQERVLHDLVDDHPELVVVERLGKVVGCAVLHRIDGDLLRPVRRDHHDRQLGVDAARMLEELETGHAAETQVGDHDVEVARLDERHRLLGARGRLDVIALLAEQSPDGEDHRLLVVDDQHSSLHGAEPVQCGSGRLTTNSAPRPGSLSTSMDPSCASTIFLEIAIPRPVPLSFVVKNGLKIRSIFSGGIPAPLSTTRTRARSSTPFSTKRSMRRSGVSAGKASIALSMMFAKTCLSFSASPTMVGPVM